MSEIQKQFDSNIASMSPAERVARMNAMFNWARELIGRLVRKVHPEASEEQLKLLVALRMYSGDRAIHKMLEQQLDNVSN